MNFVESFMIAIDSIIANKMRSFLTMLGIIIGISSVIAVVSIGTGGQKSISSQIEKIGASNLSVTVDASKAQSSDYITLEDIKVIKEKVDSVKYITPTVQKKGVAISDTHEGTSNITGSNSEYFDISNTEFLYGRGFTETEAEEGRNVAVIDEDGAKALFGESDATGKSFKIGTGDSSKKVTIVGVTTSNARMKQPGEKPVNVIVPITFMSNLYSNDFKISTATAVAVDKNDLESPANSIKIILENRHGNSGKDVYSADNPFKSLDSINNILGIVTAFIAAVAGISLLVGGIGVMNIMLVSVTERTREIGIRKAIGATTKTIMLQFLTESAIISLIGGIIGMVFGIILSQLIGLAANIVPSVSIWVVIGTILFSSSVGIFFGIYPAKKAAALDPIEALRYE